MQVLRFRRTVSVRNWNEQSRSGCRGAVVVAESRGRPLNG